MKNFKGTPGPWKCLREEVNKHYIRISSTKVGERFAVANVLVPLYDDVHDREAKETRANARLIGASPELLSAIQHLVEVYDDQTGKQWTTTSKKEAIAEARAAIDKALGE